MSVGRVVATELKPATPHQFHFWTARETTIGIGAIVRVEDPADPERVVFGVVTDAFAYSDLATPLHDVVSADGDAAATASCDFIGRVFDGSRCAVARLRAVSRGAAGNDHRRSG